MIREHLSVRHGRVLVGWTFTRTMFFFSTGNTEYNVWLLMVGDVMPKKKKAKLTNQHASPSSLSSVFLDSLTPLFNFFFLYNPANWAEKRPSWLT